MEVITYMQPPKYGNTILESRNKGYSIHGLLVFALALVFLASTLTPALAV